MAVKLVVTILLCAVFACSDLRDDSHVDAALSDSDVFLVDSHAVDPVCIACGNDWPPDDACYSDQVEQLAGCGQCMIFTCHWVAAEYIEFCSPAC